MSEERFWNTDVSINTAKFAVHDGAMTMRQPQQWDFLGNPVFNAPLS
mgnify:CR=1 FL=1